MLHVSEIMTRKIVTVALDDDLAAVRSLFDQHGFHHVMVMEEGRLAGVISDRDLLRHLSPFIGRMSERSQDLHTLQVRVHQVMTRKLTTVTANITIEEAAKIMLAENVSCLPVVSSDGQPVGIVTWRDLLQVLQTLHIT